MVQQMKRSQQRALQLVPPPLNTQQLPDLLSKTQQLPPVLPPLLQWFLLVALPSRRWQPRVLLRLL
jgi:hypothetical protein